MSLLNSGYLKENRAIAKIVEIVLGFVLCSLLCTVWYGGRGCFAEGRVGFASGVNFVVLLLNIVFFVVNVLELHKDSWRVERIYASIASIFLLIAAVLVVWYVLEWHNAVSAELIVAAILVFIEFVLLAWEVRIMQGRASNT